MGRFFTKSAVVLAGSQFLGTEFGAFTTKPGHHLVVREIALVMGSESKAWSVRKVFKIAGTSYLNVLASGTASTAIGYYAALADLGQILSAGDQIQFLTTSATAAMAARVTYEDVDETP